MKKRKMSPEWWAQRREFEREADERLKRLREVVARGLAELDEKRRLDEQRSP